jgi:iron complex outermembrane receptor protein
MKKRLLARAIAGVFAFPCAAAAQEAAVVVTGSPLGSTLFESVAPSDVLEGRSLVLQRRSTLGETLGQQPGVSSSYFGPHASRPVIRGLDGDRIRLLSNGAETHDASALSFDHAVPVDPLVAERIEVVRGPAAVLYGGNAVGGVVNILDNRIPQAPLDGVTGRAEPRFGGADRERSFGAVVEAGNGRFALHGDGFARSTENLRTPKFTLANSDAKADGGALGGAFTFDRGYVGVSHGVFRSQYGAIAEPTVRIDMKSERTDFAGELRDLAPLVSAVKFKAGRTDYEHRELDDGAVGTVFRNRGNDGRLELTHASIGPLRGTLGVTVSDFDFSAFGDEAFVPRTNTRVRSVFLYEELSAGDWKLSFGGRAEAARVRTDTTSRGFSPASGAFGALYRLDKAWTVAANASFTQRAPTYYELFADGPHAATGAWEVGDPAFAEERSRSVDLGLRWKAGPRSASVAVHQTRFGNFLAPFASGNTRTTVDGDVLPELVYRAVPAMFRGFEAQGRFRVYETLGALDVVMKGDYVKAYDRTTGQPLPRIPPLRLTLGLDYVLERWNAGIEAQHARAQRNVSPNEGPTEDFTLVNASLAHTFKTEPMALQAFVRIGNLFDREARNHVSFLKDIAPLPGRSVLAGLRASF